jgi:hypothetical protein
MVWITLFAKRDLKIGNKAIKEQLEKQQTKNQTDRWKKTSRRTDKTQTGKSKTDTHTQTRTE